MGRLSSLARGRLVALLLAAAAWSGCDGDAKKATALAPSRERSEVVIAQGPAPAAKSVGVAPIPSPPAAGLVPRKLCEGQLARPGRDWTKKPLARKSAADAKAVPPVLPTGKWLWINLWAAWCAPCKEEMPRLFRFAGRLAAAGHDVALALVSLDDDERQLEQFLSEAGEGLPRASYWLRDGREREEWLLAAGLPKAPDLPVHVLVDPRGKIRCTVTGAIDEGDYAELAAALSSSELQK